MDDNQVSDTVNGYFEDLNKPVDQPGITGLDNCWEKCIELNGYYLEK